MSDAILNPTGSMSRDFLAETTAGARHLRHFYSTICHRSACCPASAPSQGSSNHSPCSALIESTAQVKNKANSINAPSTSHTNNSPNVEASNPNSTRTTTAAQKNTL